MNLFLVADRILMQTNAVLHDSQHVNSIGTKY